MSVMKEIDLLALEIADILGTNSENVSLSQVPGGAWFADVNYCGKNIEGGIDKDPIKAMSNLLEKVNSTRLN